MSAVAPADVDAPVTLRQSPELFPTIVPLAAVAGAALAVVAMLTPTNPTPASVAAAAVRAMTCRRSQLRGLTRNILTGDPFGTSSPAGGIAAGWRGTRIGAGFEGGAGRAGDCISAAGSGQPSLLKLVQTIGDCYDGDMEQDAVSAAAEARSPRDGA